MSEQPTAVEIAGRPMSAQPPTVLQQQAAASVPITYETLNIKHKSYDASYVHRLRAFYEGGRKLLGDADLMAEVFPRHRDEHEAVYQERCRRAFYMAYAAEIIDHLVAALMAVPVTVHQASADDKPAALDDDWQKFVDDVSPPGGAKVPLRRLLRDQLLNALQVKCAWTLIDMQQSDPMQFVSRLSQEQAGALDPYAVTIDAECVYDWEEDPSQELKWVLMHSREEPRDTLRDKRNVVVERWYYYDREGWEVFELRWKKDEPPKPDTIVPSLGAGVHAFKRVPLVRLCLPDGLWAMNKLEGLAREHFNKRCALAWGETQSLLPELYEFLGPEVPGGGVMVSEAQEDEGRATNQTRGPGYMQKRGKDDDARYIGPESAPFAHALNSCQDIRDEMHRVTHSMALSVDNSAAALGRSSDSKQDDRAAQAVVLTALGDIVREHAELVLDMAARGRGATDMVGKWRTSGADKFDQSSVTDVLNQAVLADTISVPSPTFQRVWKGMVAKSLMGPEASPENIQAVEEELEKNISDEQFAAIPLEMAAPPGSGAPGEEPPPAPGPETNRRVVRRAK